jgi:hypothetical protein
MVQHAFRQHDINRCCRQRQVRDVSLQECRGQSTLAEPLARGVHCFRDVHAQIPHPRQDGAQQLHCRQSGTASGIDDQR